MYIITNIKDLLSVLFPLLDEYTLHTIKYLDYLDFKLIVNILLNSKSTRITGLDLITVKSHMAGMNSTRSHFNYSLIPV